MNNMNNVEAMNAQTQTLLNQAASKGIEKSNSLTIATAVGAGLAVGLEFASPNSNTASRVTAAVLGGAATWVAYETNERTGGLVHLGAVGGAMTAATTFVAVAAPARLIASYFPDNTAE